MRLKRAHTKFPSHFMIPVLIFFIRRLILRKSVPGKLFAEGLRNENSGFFETALLNYQRALSEVNKSLLTGSHFKTTIIEKLKVLHTVIQYKNGFNSGTQEQGERSVLI